MTRFRIVWSALACMLLAVNVLAQGNPTGTVTGRVIGQDGVALPGVTVTATSPNLQGARTVTTTDVGRLHHSVPAAR